MLLKNVKTSGLCPNLIIEFFRAKFHFQLTLICDVTACNTMNGGYVLTRLAVFRLATETISAFSFITFLLVVTTMKMEHGNHFDKSDFVHRTISANETK